MGEGFGDSFPSLRLSSHTRCLGFPRGVAGDRLTAAQTAEEAAEERLWAGVLVGSPAPPPPRCMFSCEET